MKQDQPNAVPASSTREDRVAEALRENLLRRKRQAEIRSMEKKDFGDNN